MRLRRVLPWGARAGLVARALFYLLLAYLTLRIAALSGATAQQVDANGALRLVARAPADRVVIALAGLGFALFGLTRLVAAARDRDDSRWARFSAVLQAVGSCAIAAIPFEYAFSNPATTGTEQQSKRSAAKLLGLPGGQVWVTVAGLVVVGWAVYQVVAAVRGDHLDGLHLPRRGRRVLAAIAVTGLVARAVVFLPIGVFLAVAGLTYDPKHVRGLDGELLLLTHHGWGTAVLALVAAGLADFAAYALIEARYRDVLDA